MILPHKNIRPEHALLVVGAEILGHMSEPVTVSRLWDDVRKQREEDAGQIPIAYERFILALDLLFMLNAVEFSGGMLRKATS